MAVGWILNLEDEMSEAKTYEEWTKCTGVFCDLCKKKIVKYEIALRRTSAAEAPKFCCDCAIDLCERELVRRLLSNPTGLRCAGLGAHKQNPVVGSLNQEG